MFFLKGIIVAMITPLNDGGKEVDFGALRKYCEFLIAKGVQGLFVCGTTGEGPLLSIHERQSIAEVVVDQIKGRVKVIVQTGAITTEDTLQLTKHAQQIGADAAGIVLPYFYYFDENALLEHFISISQAVPNYPLFIYNIPQCAGNNLTPRLLTKLLERVDNIAGLKTSNPDLFQLQDFLQLLGEKYSIFVGCDRLGLAGLTMGAQGIVSGNASTFPEPFINLYRAFEKGDINTAREHQVFIDKLARVLKDGRYPAFFKSALELRAIKAGGVRAPHRELLPEEESQLKKFMEDESLI